MKIESSLTSSHTITITTFSDFFSKIKTVFYPKDKTMVELFIHSGIYDLGRSTDALTNYTTKTFYLRPDFSTQILKNYVGSQTTNLTWPKSNLQEMIENVAVESAMEMGRADHLVRLSPRTWLLANPDDFTIISNGTDIVLACTHPRRNITVKVSRLDYKALSSLVSE